MNPAFPEKKDEADPSLSDFICREESVNFSPGLLNSQTDIGNILRREGQPISSAEKNNEQKNPKGFQSRCVNLLVSDTHITSMRAAGPIQANTRDHTGQKLGFIWAVRDGKMYHSFKDTLGQPIFRHSLNLASM